MEIEVGKTYQCKVAGRTVTILYEVPEQHTKPGSNGTYKYVGAIYAGLMLCEINIFTNKGQYWDDGDTSYNDLDHLVEDGWQGKIDWSGIPGQLKYVGVTSNGAVFGSSHEPVVSGDDFMFDDEAALTLLDRGGLPAYSGDWRKSVRSR